MKSKFQNLFIGLTILLAAFPAAAQHPSTHSHDQHKHHTEVNRRGDEAMGFSHKKTTHHFILKSDGGFIDVAANEAADKESVEQIRRHMKEIERLFAEGDFTKPMHTHGKMPPGATDMVKLKSEISYRYEETERGGRVVIKARNGDALRAVHEFLRFQIEDHKTGDPLEVQN